jgi:hypothetical protein
MKTASQFSTKASFGLLLVGEPGSGKTNTAMEFPDPYFIDWGDSNLKSAVERHQGKNFNYDVVDLDDNGKEVPPPQRWARAQKLLKDNGPDKAVGTIVDDSLSMIQTALTDHLCATGGGAENPLVIGGIRCMTLSLWQPFATLLRSRVLFARSLGKPYIMTAHIKVDEREIGGSKYNKPAVSGSMGQDIARLFSDYWACEVESGLTDKTLYPRGVRYYVRTAPTNRFLLKCSCNLKPEATAPEIAAVAATLK